MTDIISLIIATCAFLYAIYLGCRQTKYIKCQDELNQLLISKEKVEKEKQQCAEVDANLITIGNDKYQIKVFNKGLATAYNVEFEMPDTLWVVIVDYFPLEYLEPQKSVEINVLIPPNTQRKQKCKIYWDDKLGKHEKETILTA